MKTAPTGNDDAHRMQPENAHSKETDLQLPSSIDTKTHGNRREASQHEEGMTTTTTITSTNSHNQNGNEKLSSTEAQTDIGVSTNGADVNKRTTAKTSPTIANQSETAQDIVTQPPHNRLARLLEPDPLLDHLSHYKYLAHQHHSLYDALVKTNADIFKMQEEYLGYSNHIFKSQENYVKPVFNLKDNAVPRDKWRLFALGQHGYRKMRLNTDFMSGAIGRRIEDEEEETGRWRKKRRTR